MLDHLARKPGQTTQYQTPTSHDFQVFVVTSYGSHWHVLVGIKYPRLPEQHEGVEGMSKNVHVSNKARLLLLDALK